MIKKILILLTVLFIFASCGKKGDPKYVPKIDDKTLTN